VASHIAKTKPTRYIKPYQWRRPVLLKNDRIKFRKMQVATIHLSP
jgi:hypothetical protein